MENLLNGSSHESSTRHPPAPLPLSPRCVSPRDGRGGAWCGVRNDGSSVRRPVRGDSN